MKNLEYYIIEDLISENQLKYFSKLFYTDSMIENNSENSSLLKWVDYGGKNLRRAILPQNKNNWDQKNLFANMVEYTKEFISKNYVLKNNNLQLKKYFIHVMFEDRDIVSHIDDRNPQDEHYSAIFILNDNYKGGDFFFSKLNKKIKLKAGSLIIFKGDAKREHGVEKITEGFRISIPIFFKDEVK